MTPELAHRIHRDPRICGGAPVFRGTRVLLRTILSSLAEGVGSSALLDDFPSLTDDDIRAAIAFAASSAAEDLPVSGVPEIV